MYRPRKESWKTSRGKKKDVLFSVTFNPQEVPQLKKAIFVQGVKVEMLQKSQEFLEKLNPFTVLPNLALSLSQMLKYTVRATDLTIPTELECLEVVAGWEMGTVSPLGKGQLAPG